jgi:hypothetical protein
MNKQIMIGVSVGLLVLAVLIFVFTRGSATSESAELSKQLPPPRAGDPTFSGGRAAPTGGRGSVGHTATTDDAPKTPDAAPSGAQ